MTINWKTTLFGICASAGLVLTQVVPQGSLLFKIGGIAAAVGALGTGVAAKDKDVTGVGATARRNGQ